MKKVAKMCLPVPPVDLGIDHASIGFSRLLTCTCELGSHTLDLEREAQPRIFGWKYDYQSRSPSAVRSLEIFYLCPVIFHLFHNQRETIDLSFSSAVPLPQYK